MSIIIEELKKIKFGNVWFDDRYAELRDSKYNQAEKIEMIFRHLVWRIQQLEQQIDEIKKGDKR